MGRIDWIPIAELPEALKDGRQVLLWGDGGQSADVGVWSEVRWWDSGPGFNETSEGGPLNSVTHFAEINPPEGV